MGRKTPEKKFIQGEKMFLEEKIALLKEWGKLGDAKHIIFVAQTNRAKANILAKKILELASMERPIIWR